MSKKGSLSAAERFYIEQHAFTEDVPNIAITLDRTVSQVQEFKNEFVANKSRVGGQFARQKNVTLMTQGASQMGDTHRESMEPKPAGRKNSITTCKKKISDS